MLEQKSEDIFMDFYGLIEKNEFESLIKEAKQTCVKDAIKRLKEFNPMNETFFSALMPEGTPKSVIKKRTNKFLMKKRERKLKRLLG